MLACGLVFGVLSAENYSDSGFRQGFLNLVHQRPLHVSSILFWILICSSGLVYAIINALTTNRLIPALGFIQILFWGISIVCIIHSNINGEFGGREYWEFPPRLALLIAVSWLCFLVNVIQAISKLKNWPVYLWMWMTGTIFFLITFSEGYLWLFQYFRSDIIIDTTIQWKSSGAIVGAWNQLIYGVGIYLMSRIANDDSIGRSNTSFLLFFLGFTNLLFNWGHHIYILPTGMYIKYIGYFISMTEWIILIKIIRDWKQSLNIYKQYMHQFSFWFIIASEYWILINLFQALLMSIPVINLYTHGTHITVAHAMGTTIGINTMILLAGVLFISKIDTRVKNKQILSIVFFGIQISLLVFWASLVTAGVFKGLWLNNSNRISFSKMMNELQPCFVIFRYSGYSLAFFFIMLIVYILYQLKKSNPELNK